jgi:hypothetical protein
MAKANKHAIGIRMNMMAIPSGQVQGVWAAISVGERIE